MKPKKTSKADLEGKKLIFSEIGLALALGILFFAFEKKMETSQAKEMESEAQAVMEDEIIPITQQQAAPPPPPPPSIKLTDLIDIVEDVEDVEDDLEILDAEDETENTVTDVTDFGDFEAEDTGETEIFQVVEDSPQFKGNINKWLSENLKYPVIAQENGIQGRVFVQFVVERDGSITDIKVVRSPDSSLEKEAVRVVKSMPKWTPGKQRGKPVRVSYTLPINFQLAG